MVSAGTPGAVFPPLSPPFHGATQGGAYPLGTFTLPVVVSQFGPQSTSLPCALAWSKVRGPGVVDVAAPLTVPLATTVLATTVPVTTSATRRQARERGVRTGGWSRTERTRRGQGADRAAANGGAGAAPPGRPAAG